MNKIVVLIFACFVLLEAYLVISNVEPLQGLPSRGVGMEKMEDIQLRVFYKTIHFVLFLLIPVNLLLVNGCIFAFCTKLKEYLYFSLFLLFVAIGHFSTFMPFEEWKYAACSLVGTMQFGVIILFFHQLIFSRLTWYSWFSCILFGLMPPLFVLTKINFYVFMLIHTFWWMEICRVLFYAFKKNVVGKYFFTIGLFGWFFLNSYIFTSWLNLSGYMTLQGGYANLFLLLAMTFYLSYRFARNYKEHVALNAELEDRVERRTLQLAEANDELQQTNEYLNEANERLRELDKMKSQFVSQASHDLRTPLTAIKGSLDNLVMGIAGEINDKQKKVMSRAVKSVDRLSALVNDILDLNRIESGRVVLEKSDVPFHALVDNIINENRPAAEQKQIALLFEAAEGDYILPIDGGKMERVVGELVSNAIKYTPKQGTVTVSLYCEGGEAPFEPLDLMSRQSHLILAVKDSGIGMSEEECEKIWERFYRTNASKKVAKGSGLGLSIAKELVELHAGSLDVESEQGEGTIFTLRIPIEKG
ncbi:hypothetical protein GF373_09675 [bacterium]|nr:hypothetical protein [bacterium]